MLLWALWVADASNAANDRPLRGARPVAYFVTAGECMRVHNEMKSPFMWSKCIPGQYTQPLQVVPPVSPPKVPMT